jgi:DeoR/GlpR family transcriptional regulator of sugar metabolism
MTKEAAVSGAGRASAESVRERRRRIADLVASRGSIGIEELAQVTGVSRMTAYRDVGALERAGLISRPEPGIVSDDVARSSDVTTTLRLQRETEAKLAIARAAAERIRPGSSVLVDDSSTALLTVRELAGKSLTVITNSVLVAAEVRQSASVELMVTGGQYDPVCEALFGAAAVSMLATIQADVALLGAVAVDAAGCYHSSLQAAEVKRAMVNAARASMLLVDHSKWHEKALHRFASLADFHDVVIDAATGEAERVLLAESGATVVVPVDRTCPHCACRVAGLGSDGVRYLRDVERGKIPEEAVTQLADGTCPHCDAVVQGFGYG